MPASSSPATSLRRAVVTNEQRRVEWRVARANVVHGKIVIRANNIPPDLIGGPTTTYTLVARDGGERIRRFEGLKLDEKETVAGKKYVFV